MLYIESPSHDAYFNMALEEYMFESMPRDEEYFMLWQNKNAVVVGKYQNTIAEINSGYVAESGVQVVRRLSGGGAMYQDLGNLNFTFVVDRHNAAQLDFELFIDPVIAALREMGVDARRNSRNDIVVEDKKISGNAQYNKEGRTMHHGTLLFCSALDHVSAALHAREDKLQSKGVQSVRARVTNIAEHLPRPAGIEEFRSQLLACMFSSPPVRCELTQRDLDAIERLRQTKYETWEWNYGASPPYEITRARRYPFGGVQAAIHVEKGVVRDIAITGDFFGNGEMEVLYTALRTVPLRRDAIEKALADVDVGQLIQGMDAATLAQLLTGEGTETQ